MQCSAACLLYEPLGYCHYFALAGGNCYLGNYDVVDALPTEWGEKKYWIIVATTLNNNISQAQARIIPFPKKASFVIFYKKNQLKNISFGFVLLFV